MAPAASIAVAFAAMRQRHAVLGLLPAIRPMPLARVPQPFDHPAWIFEPKLDGFRALAYVEHDVVTLMSRGGRPFARFPGLCAAIRDAVQVRTAVLDGELVCHGDDGWPDFRRLLFRRAEPDFYAFDLLALDGVDFRDRLLIERKRRLRRLLSRQRGEPVRYVEHVAGAGSNRNRCGSSRGCHPVLQAGGGPPDQR